MACVGFVTWLLAIEHLWVPRFMDRLTGPEVLSIARVDCIGCRAVVSGMDGQIFTDHGVVEYYLIACEAKYTKLARNDKL